LAGLRRVELQTVLGVPDQPRELCKRLTRHCPNHRFPLSSRVRLNGCQLEHTRSPEYSLNRLPRTGVPGPVATLVATPKVSPYQSGSDMAYVAFRPDGGSGSSLSGNLPETGETLHGEGGEHAYHARKLVKHSNHPQTPQEHAFYARRKTSLTRAWKLTLPTHKTTRKTRFRGEREHA
ncbi:hypothetical protein Taro_000547, partial [Colocasia esculenta]|nr:hypothetical protein [Colocasia esculenta]